MNGISKHIWDVVEPYHEGPTTNVLRCRVRLHSERFGLIEVYTGTPDDCHVKRTGLTPEQNRAIYKEIAGFIGIPKVTELNVCLEPGEVPEVEAKFYLT